MEKNKMGAWACDALGNDEACGFVQTIVDRISKPIKKKKFDHFDYNEIRAAAKLLSLISKAGYILDKELVDQAIERIDLIRKDSIFIMEWDNTRDIKAELNKEHQALKLLDHM